MQNGRLKQGHHCQPPKDSALQVGCYMWEVLLLPIHHIRGHPAPWLEELQTFSGGRSQWVILISIITGMKYARSTSPQWEPEWRTWGRTWHQLGHLTGDTPLPHQYGVGRRIRVRTCHPPTQCIPITSVFPHRDQTIAAIYESKAVWCIYQKHWTLQTPEVKQLLNVEHIRS